VRLESSQISYALWAANQAGRDNIGPQRYDCDVSASRIVRLTPPTRPPSATLELPGSKSLTHRALLAAALATGTSSLNRILIADDTQLMIEALAALGVEIEINVGDRAALVHGCGGSWPNSDADLFCGNAGTVMRLLTAACAIGHGEYRLDGSPRMRERPIAPLVDALRRLGTLVEYEEREGSCPLRVHARGLAGGELHMAVRESSQFVSAVLMAAPLAMQDLLIEIEGQLPSEPFVDMTVGVMDEFGIGVVRDGRSGFIVPAPQGYHAANVEIEPDATAASYFFGAAALTGGRMTARGLGKKSCQGDLRFVELLGEMGCTAEQTDDSTTVTGPVDGRLRGITANLIDMPDVAMTLAMVALFAEGPTRIDGLANLRVKETDRLAATAELLTRFGGEVTISENGLLIHPPKEATPARIDPHGDHRLAMSAALAGLRIDGVTISEADCVSKSFPGFFEKWRELGAEIS
jgi:3-phosphoshikimate 1-carboxyvinyltransferase